MEITIKLDVNADELDSRLDKARAVVAALEEAQRLLAELVATPPPAPPAREAPPESVAKTNGHAPAKPAGEEGCIERRHGADPRGDERAGQKAGGQRLDVGIGSRSTRRSTPWLSR